jgi:hypothetical protein
LRHNQLLDEVIYEVVLIMQLLAHLRLASGYEKTAFASVMNNACAHISIWLGNKSLEESKEKRNGAINRDESLIHW